MTPTGSIGDKKYGTAKKKIFSIFAGSKKNLSGDPTITKQDGNLTTTKQDGNPTTTKLTGNPASTSGSNGKHFSDHKSGKRDSRNQ